MPIDLVPLFSYLFLRGRCRRCKQRLSKMYPITEAAAAFLFTMAYIVHGFSIQFVFLLFVISLCILVTITDWKYLRIPNSILFFFASFFVVYRLVIEPMQPWWDPFLTALICFSALAVLMAASKGGLGGGDVKLFTVLALALGSVDFLIAFFLSTLFGTATGLLRAKRTYFPFAPSISAAVLVTMFAGDWILRQLHFLL